MRTANAQAFELEEMLESRPERELGAEPRFEVVEGGGLDAHVRAGVSSEFLARVKMVVAAAVMLFILGTFRVALTSATVAQLSSNVEVREQIEDFETNNNNLRVERSLMSSATRIDRIATQNYGMVPAESFDVIVIDNGEEAEAEAEVEPDAEVAPEAEAEAPAEDAVGDEAVEDAESTPVIDAGLLAAGL